jgi:hypothetical protein
MVCSAAGVESEGRRSSSLMIVESLASVWFTGPTAEERTEASSLGMFRIGRQAWESRKQGWCFRSESMD